VLAPIGELSIAENVALPLRLAGTPWPEAHALAAPLLAALDLDELADRTTAAVSLGQLQRTALARAAVVAPALLLADEPTSHQDSKSEERILAVLRDLVDGGGACVVASHEARVADAADRVIDLDADEHPLRGGGGPATIGA
jgi:putative ABC transport system ATP-binding protein